MLDEPTLYGPVWGVAASRRATGISWMPEEHAMIKPHTDAARPEEATWREQWKKG